MKTLYLSYNRLSALPESIGQLAALERLDVSSNQLTALPDTLREGILFDDSAGEITITKEQCLASQRKVSNSDTVDEEQNNDDNAPRTKRRLN
ncbi:MAG: leucine-rich repeat domain-containing protein [Proteobacteria bacterium]|nr:leucine-rich repeat domain-containing protein [Pseudomonadota bacterium]